MLVELSSPLDAVARVAVAVDVVIPAVAAVLRRESLLDEGAFRPWVRRRVSAASSAAL